MAKPDAQVPSVTFKDKLFKSRTIVLTDGRAFQVDKRQIETTDPDLIASLEKNPEFERVAPDAVVES